MPHETIDATVVASHIVVALQSIVARNVDPAQPAVVTVGTFTSGEAGTLWRIQPSSPARSAALMMASTRYWSDASMRLRRASARHWVRPVRLNFLPHVSATVNSEAGAALMHDVAEQIVGADQVTQITPMMVGEDMAEFLKVVPGCFFWSALRSGTCLSTARTTIPTLTLTSACCRPASPF